MSTNEEEILTKVINQISELTTEFLNSSERIMKAGDNSLMALDFLALSVNNRAISLSNAFVTLANEKNYLTAATLIRLQLDNALRFFASTLVENSHDFANHFIDGKAIKDYSDIHGKKLTDSYLSKKLEEYFPGVQKLYNETCGFIHLSEKHFIPTLSKKLNKNRSLRIEIGSSENFSIKEKIDFSVTMREVSKLVVIVVEQWKHEKNKIVKAINEAKK